MTIDAEKAEAQAPVVAQSNEETASEIETTEQETTNESEAKAKDERVELPKEVEKKLSKQDRRIGKLTAEKYQLKQELEALRQKIAPDKPQSADDAPKEADFEGKPYGDYLKAVARYEARQEFLDAQTKQTKEKAETETKEWEQERAEALDENAEAAKGAFADFQTVLDKAIPKGGLAPHVRKVFLEADNGAFALYAMAKEGMLHELNDMSPARAAMAVARMEDKGIALSKKQTTKAPAPLTPAKGSASGTKDPSQMTDAEFAKWRRAQIAARN